GPNVKRFDGCAGVQLPDFNVAPMPGGATQDLRVLPDGGVLVSSGQVIARLSASGALVQTYEVAEPGFWAGLDLVGDGTFWAANYETSNVYKFDLTTGTVLSSFNAGTAPRPLVAVQPVYMHPYAVAKQITSFAYLYGRRLYLNMVAGGFKNDLDALSDTTPHDKRYARLVEYTTIISRLLTGPAPLTYEGDFH